MKNEIEQTLMRYFSKDGVEIHFWGEGNGARRFLEFYQYGDIYVGDAPDMLIVKNNEALIMEHFEFDCYYVDRKGSRNRREQFRIRKASDSILPTEEGIAFHDYIKGESSYKNYIQNVNRSFQEHYLRLSQYRDNLRKWKMIDDHIKTEVLFLIEDVSPLGTGVIERNGYIAPMVPVVLAQSEEFLDMLREKSDIDYVLACSSLGENQFIWFIEQAEIDVYYQHIRQYKDMQFLDFTPRVTVFKQLVSEDVINKNNGDI